MIKLILAACAGVGAMWVLSAVTEDGRVMVGGAVAAIVAVLLK